MSTVLLPGATPHVREQPTLDRPRSANTTRGLLECLIVSSRDQRRARLARAAAASGWASMACGDCDSVRRLASRMAVKLAFVDLEEASPAKVAELRCLAEDLARGDKPLLVLCGADGDFKLEIWARQLGVWLFLPGLADFDGVTGVCDEARTVVERCQPFGVVG